MNAMADVAIGTAPVDGGLVESKRRALSRKQWLIGGGSLLALLAIIALGVRWYTVSRFIQSTDDAFVGGDITVLANYFLRRYCTEFKRNIRRFSADAVRTLQMHEWRGNVRELENRITSQRR